MPKEKCTRQRRSPLALIKGPLLPLVFALMVLGGLTACQSTFEAETVSFERAETAYRHGDYDAALQGYHTFLKRHPKSPLASMAKLRIRCIQREVKALLDRHDMPRPIYLGSQPDATHNSAKTKKPTPPT